MVVINEFFLGTHSHWGAMQVINLSAFSLRTGYIKRDKKKIIINILSITLGRGSELLIAAMRDSATINSVALRTL